MATPIPRMLDKALLLLPEMFADGGTRSLTRIAEDIGLPLSTVHRLATSFQRHGFVVRVGRGRYLPGPALLRLATACSLNDLLVEISRPLLITLARQSRRTVHLGVLEGDMVTYLVKATPPRSELFTREGMQLEAYCSGIGKVLLASLPPEEQEAYLAGGPFVPITSNTIVTTEALTAELHTVSNNGYAIDNAEIAENLRCVAIPLQQAGNVVAAISMSAPAETLESSFVATSLAALRNCAQEIEAKLGP